MRSSASDSWTRRRSTTFALRDDHLERQRRPRDETTLWYRLCTNEQKSLDVCWVIVRGARCQMEPNALDSMSGRSPLRRWDPTHPAPAPLPRPRGPPPFPACLQPAISSSASASHPSSLRSTLLSLHFRIIRPAFTPFLEFPERPCSLVFFYFRRHMHSLSPSFFLSSSFSSVICCSTSTTDTQYCDSFPPRTHAFLTNVTEGTATWDRWRRRQHFQSDVYHFVI